MRGQDRYEIIGLAVLTGMMTVMMLSSQSSLAAPQTSGSGCSISFQGGLASLDMTPSGSWSLTSSSCRVTGVSGGILTGTFTGFFVSEPFNGTVSGTWTTGADAQRVVASSTGFSVSFSADTGVGAVPLLGSAYQGILSGTGGLAMFVVGTGGQISLS